MPYPKQYFFALCSCVALGLCLSFAPRATLAVADVEGSGDHPLVERIAGSFIHSAFRDEFKRVTLPAGLATIAELMRARQELGLLVVGHTDDVGNFDYNLRLSMERATAVIRYLSREHGIAESRLRSAGAGMMAPIASNRTEAGRAQNRRVELVELRD